MTEHINADDRALPWRGAVICLVIVSGFALRVALANYSFWADEWYSLYFADQPFGNLWGEWMVQETNPPLFYSMVKLWAWLGANSIVTLRLLPILGGAIGAGLIAMISWRKYDWWGALTTSVIVTLSYNNIYISQLLRTYIFVTDSVLLSLFGLLLWLEQGERRRLGLALYIVGAVAGCYLHTTMILWPVVATISVVLGYWRELVKERFQLLRRLIVADIGIALLSSWWLWITFEQLRGGAHTVGWLRPLPMGEYSFLVGRNIFFIYDVAPSDLVAHWFVRGLIAMGVLVGLRSRFTRFLTITIVVGVVLTKIVDVVHPIANGKTVYWMAIFTTLIVAGGVSWVRSASLKVIAIVAIAGVLSANVARHRSEFVKQDWTNALATIAHDRGSAMLVQSSFVADLTQRACLFQFGRKPCPFPIVVLDTADPAARTQPQLYAAVASKLAPYSRIYSVRDVAADPLVALCITTPQARPSWYEPFLEGPFTPQYLLEGKVAGCKMQPGFPLIL